MKEEKKMSKPISTRLKEAEIKRLNEIAEEEKIDRSALIRKYVLLKIQEHDMKKMAAYYHRGLLSLQESATKKSDVFWKPPVGKTQIRIVPYQHNKDWPFQELYFHYEVGKKTMVSPSSYGRPDPILEFAVQN